MNDMAGVAWVMTAAVLLAVVGLVGAALNGRALARGARRWPLTVGRSRFRSGSAAGRHGNRNQRPV